MERDLFRFHCDPGRSHISIYTPHVVAAGFEPDGVGCINAGLLGAASQRASHGAKIKLEGWEVLEAWGDLPEALRAAILGIVRSFTGGEAKRSAEPVPPEPQGLRGGESPSLHKAKRGARHITGSEGENIS
jgi:hypothetical protein